MLGLRKLFLLGCLLVCGVVKAAPVKVVASFSILGDFVRQVGGERVALTEIVGPDQDAHVYEPRTKDVTAVAQADLIVVNGLHFEGFLERLIKAGAGAAPVVALSDGAQVLSAGEDERGIMSMSMSMTTIMRTPQTIINRRPASTITITTIITAVQIRMPGSRYPTRLFTCAI